MATGRLVAKALIEYNNRSEGNDEKVKEPINIAYWAKKTYNDENANDFKWSYVKEEDEEDIGLANFIENLQK